MDLGSDASATAILSAKVEAHRAYLEKEYQTKSDLWQGALARHQSAQDQTNKYEQKVDKQQRAQGQNCFNSDGSLNFLSGYSGESHLRSPLEIIKELLRYIESDMLRLRQGRVETLLFEFIDSMNNDVLCGRYPENSKESFQLKQNLSITVFRSTSSLKSRYSRKARNQIVLNLILSLC